MPKLKEIQAMAKKLGLRKTAGMNKSDLIRAVQVAEGNSPCYERISDCGQTDCLFRADCQPQAMRL